MADRSNEFREAVKVKSRQKLEYAKDKLLPRKRAKGESDVWTSEAERVVSVLSRWSN